MDDWLLVALADGALSAFIVSSRHLASNDGTDKKHA